MMYTCAAEFDFIEAEVGDVIRTIYFLAISQWLPLKAFSQDHFLCFQTLIRYIKTMLLPVNMLIVGFIAGRVSCFLLDNGWFPSPKFCYVCPAFICLPQYFSKFTVFRQFSEFIS